MVTTDTTCWLVNNNYANIVTLKKQMVRDRFSASDRDLAIAPERNRAVLLEFP